MDNAATAVNKLFGTTKTTSTPEPDRATRAATPRTTDVESVDVDIKDKDQTVDSQVNAPVEHTHVKKQHETKEQTFVEKERHQDHYHTTIQPLKDSSVADEKHDYTQETKNRTINKDSSDAKEKAKRDLEGVKSTSEEKQFESKTVEPTKEREHVHHHLHETIQPVIEKGKLPPLVRSVGLC